ncbi:MAG: response regulator [Desulfobacteraceae bacterium]|nr:MAG: response regulator [Desulfobacteraceae bacterium]
MSKILAIGHKQDSLTYLIARLKNLMPQCTVLTAHSGPEGIEKAEAEPPDMILIDTKMPGTHGFDVFKRLKSGKSTKHIPVVMLTDDTTDSKSCVKGLEFGAHAFLDKSIDENVLIAQINALLRTKKQEDLLRKEKDRIEALLRRAQKTEAISTLAGGIAHDFNNILTAIIGYTEIALGRASQDTPIHNNLEEVLKAGYRARDLVKQLLTFSRQSEQEQKPLQIGLILKEAIKMLRASLPTSIEIRQVIKNDCWKIMADPIQIYQVLMNLCTNAAHSMHEEGGILEVALTNVELDSQFTARHPDLKPGPYVKLTVSDTGHGIPLSIIKKVFDPHFANENEGDGTGLGLTVVHGIVKNHGGAITVNSEHNKGSVFNIFFPRIAAESLPKIDISTTFPRGNERILFVDDERVLAELGEQLLVPLGYKVTTQTKSIEALETFKAQPEKFDLVMTDMTMPDMTGFELARKLLQTRSDLPIILFSGFSKMVTEEKAKAIGIREFVMKPIDISEMAKIVRRALDNKAPRGGTR